MTNRNRLKSLLIFIAAMAGGAVSLRAEDTLLVQHLRQHVQFLSSDDLQGRQTGSAGEKKAYKYIIGQYKEIGILPVPGYTYTAAFEYHAGKRTSGRNRCTVNAQPLILHEDYYPLNISGNGKARGPIVDVGYGISASAIQYDSYQGLTNVKGKIFLIESSTPEGDNPHSKYGPYAGIQSKVDAAVAKGAVGIIFTNTHNDAADPEANLEIRSFTAPIPVVFMKAEAWKKMRREQLNMAEMTVNLQTVRVEGHNVIGFLDNGAPSTVVIGAHYDHLGYNEYGGSLYRGDPAIHNGADDNASGTAGVIELARFLASNGIRESNNYLFMNFSGEEMGLVGSKYWLAHATFDTSRINYMINMDMIGRYRTEKGLEIGGVGSSPAFSFIMNMQADTLKFKTSEKGIGPSDHASFYLAGMPVLFFFTGTHEDYHKPTDDAGKVNYGGTASIIHLVEKIVTELDNEGMLPFTKTKEEENAEVPQFKVKLGIVPDYMFEGPGLRVDGVNEGQPAALAGILKGDVILAIGNFNTVDIMAYMHALAAHKKGDTVPVTVKRNEEQLTLQVTF